MGKIKNKLENIKYIQKIEVYPKIGKQNSDVPKNFRVGPPKCMVGSMGFLMGLV